MEETIEELAVMVLAPLLAWALYLVMTDWRRLGR